MYALCCIVAEGHNYKVLPGTLFRTPVELLSPEQVRRYIAAKSGWSICPLGFYVFVKSTDGNARLIFPGIVVPGEKTPKRKFPEYNVKFAKKEIEEYSVEIVQQEARAEQATAVAMQALTHDLRALSAEIYNAAELLKTEIEYRNYAVAAVRTDTVIAAQQILSIRLDMVDFSTKQFIGQPAERIGVYKKVDKVHRCFQPKALASNRRISISGPSIGLTFGPPTLELVPFVLIENAIKYAPENGEIKVKVTDSADAVCIHVWSYGPKIRIEERRRIFEQHYRGIEARASGLEGSGLGLFAAHKIVVDDFGGTIAAFQDEDPMDISGKAYWSTKFTCVLPRVD